METNQQQNIILTRQKTSGMTASFLSLYTLLLTEIYNFSREIWESNLKIVEEHNLQADFGVHTYWLGMNKYADLVYFYSVNFHNSQLFVLVQIDH